MQVLKDEQRRKIIMSAKEELLQHGYKDASMRRIAKEADMTVGNLYRYFANKDELINYIVQPTLDQINNLIQTHSNKQVSLYQKTVAIDLSIKMIEDRVFSLAEGLVDIVDKNRDEMKILILNSELSNQMINWFANLLKALIEKWIVLDEKNKELTLILGEIYAESISCGLMKILYDYEKYKDKCDITKLIQFYLDSFIFMINVKDKRGYKTET